jgi:hypothetical protein
MPISNIESGYEDGGELVYRWKPTNAEVLRITDEGVTYPDQVVPDDVAASEPWVFDIRDYGAVADDSTDDTTAIRDALAAAVAYAEASAAAFAIVRGAGSCVASGALVTGATLGNAQIPLPLRASTLRKLTIVFEGPAPSDAHVHWQQETGQRYPWTIRSTLTGQVVDGSHGAPSVIGGPTPQNGYGSAGGANGFNNVHIVFRNMGVVCPLNPSLVAFDLRGFAQATIDGCGALANGTPAEMLLRQGTTGYTSTFSAGFLLPQNLNNDLVRVDSLSVQGFYTGTSITEHTAAQRVACIYCHDGVYIQADGNGNHSPSIENLSVEATDVGIYTDGGANPAIGIHIAMYDTEGVDTHVDDAQNALGGLILWNDNNNATMAPTVVGGRNVQIIATRRDRGPVASPAVPATTVALVNPFYRDADVFITGGTVTAVAIDGITVPGSTVAGWFPVPTGATITLTYSVAPTWTWWLR